MDFKYDRMPALRPITIKTKDKGFFGATWLWLWGSRTWELVEPWSFSIDGRTFIIPKGFVFDGASIPKYFWNWLSPVGVLLIPGLVHDYLYANEALMQSNNVIGVKRNRKECDQLFRDIAIEVNGFKSINWIAYGALRPFGWIAWNKHRKNK